MDKNKKILIVDDEPNIVMALEFAFRKEGFEVFVARDGEEALQCMQTEIPHLVIMDIMMPKLDGYETLKVIKSTEELKHIEVILISAKNKEKDIVQGMNLGAAEYFIKPFAMKKLINRTKEMLVLQS